MRTILLLAVMLALPALAAGAADEPLVPRAEEPGEQPAPEYDPTGLRDPFRPFTLDLRRETRRHPTPLQRYELGQLTVVGTVWELSPPRAMVEDSNGMGYIVTLGTLIGPNGGVVTAIEAQRVIVEERVLDYYGKEQVSRIVMETPKEGGRQVARERR